MSCAGDGICSDRARAGAVAGGHARGALELGAGVLERRALHRI
jgi:hypothetical protein